MPTFNEINSESKRSIKTLVILPQNCQTHVLGVLIDRSTV